MSVAMSSALAGIQLCCLIGVDCIADFGVKKRYCFMDQCRHLIGNI